MLAGCVRLRVVGRGGDYVPVPRLCSQRLAKVVKLQRIQSQNFEKIPHGAAVDGVLLVKAQTYPRRRYVGMRVVAHRPGSDLLGKGNAPDYRPPNPCFSVKLVIVMIFFGATMAQPNDGGETMCYVLGPGLGFETGMLTSSNRGWAVLEASSRTHRYEHGARWKVADVMSGMEVIYSRVIVESGPGAKLWRAGPGYGDKRAARLWISATRQARRAHPQAHTTASDRSNTHDNGQDQLAAPHRYDARPSHSYRTLSQLSTYGIAPQHGSARTQYFLTRDPNVPRPTPTATRTNITARASMRPGHLDNVPIR
ncbi:hypothetical protein BD779DRAFT_1787545 [Infundibulicybe gibba]|nr:hypothetical protein BD779DRAFT_1787545 [Infundibulicybe gibba]